MKRKIKIISIVVVTLLVIAVFGYQYIFFDGARNLKSENTTFIVNSKSIFKEFSSNIDNANKKYLEKAIVITGIITSIKNNEIIIDNVVICNFDTLENSLKVDQTISVKGRVVGFDDLLGELQLDKCILNNN